MHSPSHRLLSTDCMPGLGWVPGALGGAKDAIQEGSLDAVIESMLWSKANRLWVGQGRLLVRKTESSQVFELGFSVDRGLSGRRGAAAPLEPGLRDHPKGGGSRGGFPPRRSTALSLCSHKQGSRDSSRRTPNGARAWVCSSVLSPESHSESLPGPRGT